MKSLKLGLLLATFALALTLVSTPSEARRFGGGKSFGMQRAAPAKPAPNNPPAAAPNANPGAAGAAGAATPKRSWMGPIAGLAAGLGIAALFSHLGMGEELGNFVMLALLTVVAIVAIRWAMRRFGAGHGPALATAGAAGAAASAQALRPQAESAGVNRFTGLNIGSALPGATGGSALSGAGAPALPADFDVPGFERIAKMIFIRMQAANDSADLNDLRAFTTPEVFAELRLDLQERGASAQHTDVEQVDAQVLDFAQEDGRQIVSVRYHGQLRESTGAEALAFDEVWHLVKADDSSPAWAIAGIQQRQ